MNILAVVAHPDDEVIGCGGTLAKLRQNGHEVRVVLALKRNDPRGIEHWESLKRSFEESCNHLGATPVISEEPIDERCAESDIVRLHDSVIAMVEWADIVFTHSLGDANQVHRGVGRAVEVATRPFRRRREVYQFEIATSTEQAFSYSFAPNSYSILNEEHARKKSEAMGYYPTELVGGRTPAGLLRKLQVRGDEIGVEFAEAFCLVHHFF
jgi:LmbE family N-acetylglucosaminyl deacetylase